MGSMTPAPPLLIPTHPRRNMSVSSWRVIPRLGNVYVGMKEVIVAHHGSISTESLHATGVVSVARRAIHPHQHLGDFINGFLGVCNDIF